MLLPLNLIFLFLQAVHLISVTMKDILFKKKLDGFRVGAGLSLSILLSLGRNDEINNNILTSISSMIETGYNYYMRERRGSKDYYTDDGYMYMIIIVLF